ncbi:13220_t:CDS:2 [Ambispora leptoticha]|uniref:13220_t:CDS:1 n=1 Tax=Ambispora leptoticha TaxID=144679 RepID=A0A9N9BW67_9GLOM|nr:13220_t:CDS:2 [Ambispora leptoticha]
MNTAETDNNADRRVLSSLSKPPKQKQKASKTKNNTSKIKDSILTQTLLKGMTAEDVPFPQPELIQRILSNSRRAVRVSTGGGGKNNNNNDTIIPKSSANINHNHSAKKKRNEPPRPPNNFFLFRHALHLHLSNLSLKVPQVSVAAGILWDNALPNTKAYYSNLQSMAKEWHLKMYPGYVYRPRRAVKKLSKSNSSSNIAEVAVKTSNAIDTRNIVISDNEITQNSTLSSSIIKNDDLYLVNEQMITKSCKNHYPKKYPLSPITTTESETSLHSPPISPLLQQQQPSPSGEFQSHDSFLLAPEETRKMTYTEAYQIALLHRNIMIRQNQEDHHRYQEQESYASQSINSTIQIDPNLAFTSDSMNLYNTNNSNNYRIYQTQQHDNHENNDDIQSTSVDEYSINHTNPFSLETTNGINNSNNNAISISSNFSEWIKYDTPI